MKVDKKNRYRFEIVAGSEDGPIMVPNGAAIGPDSTHVSWAMVGDEPSKRFTRSEATRIVRMLQEEHVSDESTDWKYAHHPRVRECLSLPLRVRLLIQASRAECKAESEARYARHEKLMRY